MEDELRGLMEEDDQSSMEAVKILTTEENVDMKTEIHHPLMLALMDAVRERLEDLDYNKSSKFMERLVNRYKKYMVSKDRKSRNEILKALKNLAGREESVEGNQSLKELMTEVR